MPCGGLLNPSLHSGHNMRCVSTEVFAERDDGEAAGRDGSLELTGERLEIWSFGVERERSPVVGSAGEGSLER